MVKCYYTQVRLGIGHESESLIRLATPPQLSQRDILPALVGFPEAMSMASYVALLRESTSPASRNENPPIVCLIETILLLVRRPDKKLPAFYSNSR
jgi:hypothetical protein